MVKRTLDIKKATKTKKQATSALKAPKFKNEYSGYYPDVDTIESIQLSDIEPETFYKNYVQKRKPVIIEGVIPGIQLDQFQPSEILNTLKSSELLLVEKRYKGGFGSGTERVKMTFQEFMEKLENEDGDKYYLTTQYTEDDPDAIRETLAEESLDESDLEDESDAKAAALDFPQLSAAGDFSDFSDVESIDLDNLHDDFEDSDGELTPMQRGDNDGDDDDDDDDVLEDAEIAISVIGDALSIEEAKKRVQELVQKPLTNLIRSDSLPLQPALLSKLFPQQINLWIGSASPIDDRCFKIKEEKDDYGLGRRIFGGGVSSGLHHDHADNLYIPIKGSKRFTVFAPSDADKMYTVGQINHIYDSGIIDYKNNENAPGWRELRSDSAIITEVAKWRLDNDDGSLNENERAELIELIEDEEEILTDFEKKVIDGDGIKRDPPSFSKVPASIVHIDKIKDEKLRSKLVEFAETNWPQFFKANRMTGYLKPGQMLYLPTGWFHEVSSFGDNEKSKTHIALNYWYSPPNHKDNVYKDKYWEEDFERTMKSCQHFSLQP